MRQSSHQRHHPNGQAGPFGTSSGRPRALHPQRRHQHAVAGHAHGGEEEYAGVHIQGGDRAHHLAHDSAKRPAEVQSRVHGPEGQSEDELEVCQCQAHHKAVDRRVVARVVGVEQKERQEVTHKPQHAHHQVHQCNEDTQLRKTCSVMKASI